MGQPFTFAGQVFVRRVACYPLFMRGMMQNPLPIAIVGLVPRFQKRFRFSCTPLSAYSQFLPLTACAKCFYRLLSANSGHSRERGN